MNAIDYEYTLWILICMQILKMHVMYNSENKICICMHILRYHSKESCVIFICVSLSSLQIQSSGLLALTYMVYKIILLHVTLLLMSCWWSVWLWFKQLKMTLWHAGLLCTFCVSVCVGGVEFGKGFDLFVNCICCDLAGSVGSQQHWLWDIVTKWN